MGTGHLTLLGYLCRSSKCWMTDFSVKQAGYAFALPEAFMVPGTGPRKQPPPVKSQACVEKRHRREGGRAVASCGTRSVT